MAQPSKRIYVVEDSALIRTRLIENIEALGKFSVVGVADTEDEAVEGIVRTKPDIVVTDIRLKQGSGIEVVRRVRTEIRQPSPRLYVLTNYAYPEYKRQCSLLGADDFFDKSSEYERLLSVLRDDA
jgi:DNA-binding NarL/FixJ family response regulator